MINAVCLTSEIVRQKCFSMQVKRNLHMVLSFSPVGGEFRERLRKFPSLVNCTTIDWFSEWPRDALHTVAHNFLADLPGVDAKVRPCLLLLACTQPEKRPGVHGCI